MRSKSQLPAVLRILCSVAMLFNGAAGAHTLPVSYLRLQSDSDYVHFELIFNPFELTFLPEVDDNRDGELSFAELEQHGKQLADRVVGAFQLSVGGKPLQAETAGMDPDLNGHHVRVRAHYKVDSPQLPLTLESDLIAIMSASHLTQVTYANGGSLQMAQLDSLSRKVTFTGATPKRSPTVPVTPRARAVVGWRLTLLTISAVLLIGAGIFSFLRKPMKPLPE